MTTLAEQSRYALAKRETLLELIDKLEAENKRLMGFLSDTHQDRTFLLSLLDEIEAEIVLMPQSGSGYDYWVGRLRAIIKRQSE